jgi:hypothetical protein
MQTVVIDPDGTQSWCLLLVFPAETGTTYESQCAGVATEQRQIEGYLVPVGDQVASAALRDFFARQFRGNPPPYGGNDWTGDALDELADLVGQVPYWYRKPDGTDSRTMLSLNVDRVSELTEAWVPVRTADGDAILLFKNSD